MNHLLWGAVCSSGADLHQMSCNKFFSKWNTISNTEGVANMVGRCGEEPMGDEG